MNRTRVKICGITTESDALLAAAAGADYLGVIFAESARRVDLARAQAIRAAVPSLQLVGVFRDQPVDDVVRLVIASGADLVQLHGAESPAYCDEVLARTGKPVIKAFDAAHLPDTPELAAYQTTSYFLFDAAKSDAAPDVSRVWDEASRQRRLGFRVFVAGALNADNVRDAIRRTDAFAVDVCRGVEQAPGVKDADAVLRFIAEARA